MITAEPADWIRTLAVGTVIYVGLVALLRVSGKRTLAKLNAFDLVVTVALGSLLASAVIDRNVGLVQAAVGIGLLIALQVAVSWCSVRWQPLRRLVTATPTSVALDGVLDRDAMRRARVTEDEIRASVRGAGLTSLADIRAVVLETDGTISVVRRGAGDDWALGNLLGVT